MSRVLLLLVLPLLVYVSPVVAGKLPDALRARIVEEAAARLEQNYVFADRGAEMANAIRQRAARGAYAELPAEALATALTRDLQEISRDKHVRVIHHEDPAPLRSSADRFSPEELAEMTRQMSRVNFGFARAEHLEGNIGYLDIRAFVDPAIAGPTASAALSFVANSDALILDLRNNFGGSPAMVAFVASYVLDRPTHINDLVQRAGNRTDQSWTSGFVAGQRFGGTKPLFVLTSARTFSAAEELAYDLQALGRAKVVGERTAGGAHRVRPFPLAPHFDIAVPYQRAVNPVTGTNWEGRGVSPDVEVPAEAALARSIELAGKTK